MNSKVNDPTTSCSSENDGLPEDKQQPEKQWIKFLIQDDKGKPIPGVTIQVTLPDKSISESTSGPDGIVAINNLDPGTCKLESNWRNVSVENAMMLA